MVKEKGNAAVLSTALLKVKYVSQPMNPENIPFEEFIESPNMLMKIDFADGKSLVEEKYKSVDAPIEKFYIEFFDEYNRDDMISYLTDTNRNYRVTSSDGAVIRLSREDDALASNEKEEDTSGLREFIFMEEKKGFFDRMKNLFQKKDA